MTYSTINFLNINHKLMSFRDEKNEGNEEKSLSPRDEKKLRFSSNVSESKHAAKSNSVEFAKSNINIKSNVKKGIKKAKSKFEIQLMDNYLKEMETKKWKEKFGESSPRISIQRPHSVTRRAAQAKALAQKILENPNGYEDRSLCFLSLKNPIRYFFIRVMEWKWFERFVLLIILLNSLSLAFTDMNCVDISSQTPTINGFSISDMSKPCFSQINLVFEYADYVFTAIFAAEMIVKVIGRGFIGGRTSYIKNNWNKLDFLVVVTSIISIFGESLKVPKFSILRVLRVLRPLKSIRYNPKMRRMVEALFRALPHLGNVSLVLTFFCSLFMILGVQLWKGNMYNRCRLTELPISLPPELVDTYRYAEFQFMVAPSNESAVDWFVNFLLNRTEFPFCDFPLSDPSWNQASSPWGTPQNCVWPVDVGQNNNITFDDGTWQFFGNDQDQYGVCSQDKNLGRQCPGPVGVCGSNWDDFGNPRFNNIFILHGATFLLNMNFGYTTFNSYPQMMSMTFQVLTSAAWSDVMYTTESFAGIVARFYFFIWILFGSLFFLNLFIAVIWDNFDMEDIPNEVVSNDKEMDKKIKEIQRRQTVIDKVEKDGVVGKVEKEGAIVKLEKEVTEKRGTFLQKLVEDNIFQTFIILCILTNAVVLAMNIYPSIPMREYICDQINFGLSMIFVLEMILKLIALRLGYFNDGFNSFDGFIVVLSIIEYSVGGLPMYIESSTTSDRGFITIFRVMRLLRVFKLARSWKSFQILLTKIYSTILDVGNFIVLFILVIFIFALIGMSFFGNQMHFDQYGYKVNIGDLGYEGCKDMPIEYPGACSWVTRNNFDNIGWAMLTVFQIMSTDNWNNVWYDVRRSSSEWGSNTFMIAIVIFGQFIMLSLFVSVLLVNFQRTNEELAEIQILDDIAHKQLEKLKRMANKSKKHLDLVKIEHNSKDHILKKKEKEDGQIEVQIISNILENPSLGSKLNLMPDMSNQKNNDQSNQSLKSSKSSIVNSKCDGCKKDTEHCICLFGYSLGCLSPTNPFRIIISTIVHHHQFENIILTCIFASSIILAIDNPLFDPAPSTFNTVLLIFNYIFSATFAVEMLFKMITLGVSGYLQSVWNWLDGTLVAVSIVSLILHNAQIASLRTLRIIRALRPLRVISRNEGMKLIVNTLFESIPTVFNVLVVLFVFYFIFAIIAVSFLKGSMYFCVGMPLLPFTSNQISQYTKAQQQLITYPVPYFNLTPIQQSWFTAPYGTNTTATSFDVCQGLNPDVAPSLFWVRNQAQNFDNFIQAMWTFYQITTMEEWTYVAYESMDARGPLMHPVRDNNPFWGIYFSVFMLFGVIFCKNLVVGAVVDSFNAIKERIGGSGLLTESQKQWIDAHKVIKAAILRPRLKRPINFFCGVIFDIVTHLRFEFFIMLCTFINAIVMALEHFGEPEWWTLSSIYFNFVFSGIFTIEALLKIFIFGKKYFKDNWNLFDLAIVIGSDFEIILVLTSIGRSIDGLILVFRAFRVARILRLVKQAKGLQQLLDTMILSFPSLANISSVYFLVLYIFAVVGVELFGKSMLNQQFYITGHSNFQTVWNAFFVLYKWSTDELAGSVGLSGSTQLSVSECVVNPPYDPNMCGFQSPGSLNQTSVPNPYFCTPLNGCGVNEAYIFGTIYIFIINYVLLNVFVAIILEQFGDNDNGEVNLNKNVLADFSDRWTEIDRDASGFMQMHDFSNLLFTLPAPLGKENMTKKEHRRLLLDLDIPLVKDKITGHHYIEFIPTALAMAKHLVESSAKAKGETLEEIPDHILRKNNFVHVLSKTSKVKKKDKHKVNEPLFKSAHVTATILLQRSIRLRKMKKLVLADDNKNLSNSKRALLELIDYRKEKKSMEKQRRATLLLTDKRDGNVTEPSSKFSKIDV